MYSNAGDNCVVVFKVASPNIDTLFFPKYFFYHFSVCLCLSLSLFFFSGADKEMIAAILVTVSEEYARIAVKAVNSLAK